ncbi:hypothetical protein NQ314_015767 [Rhamnusium bicolor]|uniref:PiggyBac transposable element-derived protein domain-containing protein n=1 Tax=Rhamnusium bicolor TaxID=1586634 RepID=A0AAV8WXA6_9CUCU|nr:hypothetical protein NQ314_015767 [Rhamnusium bicolor]
MLGTIVESTNKYIEKIAPKYKRERSARPTDIIEIKAFLDLLYLSGCLKGARLNLEELWNRQGCGVEMFWLKMSLARFRFLLRMLRFDDWETRDVRKSLDKLAPIRSVFDKFVTNCINHYAVGEYVTIDEKLEAFREVYVGQQPAGPYNMKNDAQSIIERLIAPISGKSRNLTCDNWFTTLPLINSLFNNHKLTYVDTVRKNRRGLPLEFKNTKARPITSSMFGFQKNVTLVSYVPKANKNVLLASSLHHDDNIDKKTKDQNKPEIITFYNSTKGGVDMVDQPCSRYDGTWHVILEDG